MSRLEQAQGYARTTEVRFLRLPSWMIWLTVIAAYAGLFAFAWLAGFEQ